MVLISPEFSNKMNFNQKYKGLIKFFLIKQSSHLFLSGLKDSMTGKKPLFELIFFKFISLESKNFSSFCFKLKRKIF